MAIEWAPLSIPLKRRLQTLAAAIWILTMLFGEFIAPIVFILFLVFGNIYIKIACVLYGLHIYNNLELSENGARGYGIRLFRQNIYYEYLRSYFPINLVKTADLPPNKNYLFAVYPHGIISCGVMGNFISISPKFKELFPKIRTTVLTLKMNFNIPFWRELLYSWGLHASSSASLRKILAGSNDSKDPANGDGNTSTACIVVVGGAQEALYARPNNYQIIIKNRKGFIKIALETGSDIVPIFSFGEVDLFDQVPNPPGSKLRRFQEAVKNYTGIAPALFQGRGFFQYTFGVLPHRRPITTVVGAPIPIIKTPKPTNEEIDKVHTEFVTQLQNLFNTHKSKYIQDQPNIELIME